MIDADMMLYAAGFATEGEPLSHTLHTLNQMIEKQLRETDCESYQLYISGVGNFREDLVIDYKATRSARKPLAYGDMRDHLFERWKAESVDGMETDDMVSILLWEDFQRNHGDPALCTLTLSSPDKDLNNTPGWHYNPRTGQVTWVSALQAHRHFMYQLLMGDRTDNIKGLPKVAESFAFKYGLGNPPRTGCGQVWAKKIMGLCGAATGVVYEAYQHWGDREGMSDEQTKQYMQTQGQLLWMTREMDPITGLPKLWEVDEELWNDRRNRETDIERAGLRGVQEEAPARGTHGGGDAALHPEGSGEGGLHGGSGGLADDTHLGDTRGNLDQDHTG